MADLRVWDNAGNMIPNKTVQDWIDFYTAQGYSGNFFINKKCYDFFTLSVRTPLRCGQIQSCNQNRQRLLRHAGHYHRVKETAK